MLAFNIKDTKKFMNSLLKENTFDSFIARSIKVKTFVTFDIDCSIDKAFFENGQELKRDYCNWYEIKRFVFDIIKGRRLPAFIKIVLSLDNERMNSIADNAAAMFFNITFENNSVICTTAASQKVFSMDKSVDSSWDNFMMYFLDDAGIEYNTQ